MSFMRTLIGELVYKTLLNIGESIFVDIDNFTDYCAWNAGFLSVGKLLKIFKC